MRHQVIDTWQDNEHPGLFFGIAGLPLSSYTQFKIKFAIHADPTTSTMYQLVKRY